MHASAAATHALLLGLVGVSAVPALVSGRAAGPTGFSRDMVIERLVAPDAHPLTSYRALRHLAATTRGGRMHAEMVAMTTLSEEGLEYDVIAESGSPLIRKRVLHEALRTEKDGQAAGRRDQGALLPANYEFGEVSTGPDTLLRLEMKPRRRHPLLVEGALFFDPDTSDLVRMEGELSKRPSFWTRRARITREYGRVDGVRVPLSMRSTADVLIVGESSFDMTYEYLEINGLPVTPRAVS